MKIFVRTLSLFLSLIIYLTCFSIRASATVAATVVPVTAVEQAKSLWCWAACSEMCGKSINNSSTLTQYDVVEFRKGNQNNQKGDLIDVLFGCKFVAKFSKDFTNGMLNFSQIGSQLYKNQCVIACLSPGQNMLGHCVLIYGTQVVDGNGGTRFFIDYIDPYDASRTHCLFENFCNGTGNNLKGYKVYTMVYAV